MTIYMIELPKADRLAGFANDGELEFRCGGLPIRFSLADIYEDVVLP